MAGTSRLVRLTQQGAPNTEWVDTTFAVSLEFVSLFMAVASWSRPPVHIRPHSSVQPNAGPAPAEYPRAAFRPGRDVPFGGPCGQPFGG
ncbi:hypothetical protein GCM10017771_79120 [Streptomyces capitiformicae]|uniref:Uncharacterized protein n=1 Tax=Streptomyces capitiformicae TaxID=2014920 RepID=A0A918ZJM3_9ACTN|nr:hypothetical protein GCM10017771_79120 [Streptomyces capitiformicae]